MLIGQQAADERHNSSNQENFWQVALEKDHDTISAEKHCQCVSLQGLVFYRVYMVDYFNWSVQLFFLTIATAHADYKTYHTRAGSIAAVCIHSGAPARLHTRAQKQRPATRGATPDPG